VITTTGEPRYKSGKANIYFNFIFKAFLWKLWSSKNLFNRITDYARW